MLSAFEDAPGEWNGIQILNDRDSTLGHVPLSLSAGPTHAAESNILLRNVEFPEHVLEKRVVYVVLDPIQSNDAPFKLIGEFSIDDG